MESTTDLNEAAGKVRSRRVLLAGAVGGLAAWLAAAAQRAMPAEASAGDPILAGRSNSAGEFSTELRARTTKPTLRAVQLGGGAGLRAEAKSGRAVMATARAGGTAVWAHSPNHFGVKALTDTGFAVYAEVSQGHSNSVAVYAVAVGRNSKALEAHGPTLLDGTLGVGGPISAGSGVTLPEMNPNPAAPSSNQVRLFARDNGSGKTQICAKFATGDVQVLATEP